MKKLIPIIMLLTTLSVADVVTHGWILFKDKTPAENLADASTLLAHINANYPQINPYSGKAFQYWMAEPLNVKTVYGITNILVQPDTIEQVIGIPIVTSVTNELGEVTEVTSVEMVTNTVPNPAAGIFTNIVYAVTNTGMYIVYVRPCIMTLLTESEKAAITAELPANCFVEEQ